MFILSHIVKPGVFIYYVSPGHFNMLRDSAFLFRDRESATRVASCYADIDLQIEEA